MRPKRQKRLTHLLRILVSDDQRGDIEHVADDLRWTKSEVVRQCIRLGLPGLLEDRGRGRK